MEKHTTDLDFGYVKQVISTIPVKHFFEHNESYLQKTPQDLIDESYEATMASLIYEINCQYFNEAMKTKFSKGDAANFVFSSLNTDRLQKNNIFLSSKLWRQAALAPKTNILNGSFQKSIDEDLKRLNFSEISAVIHHKNKTISFPTLTTIQFDFNNLSSGGAKEINDVSKFYFDTLFSKCVKDDSPQSICNVASHTLDFSIHKYYLPSGITSPQPTDACLLFRYDHCPVKHKNGSMPPLYKNVYPEFVAEPHFHFTSGFGSVYKLNNKNEEHTFGVGYAIGVSGLKDYLEKILGGNYSSQKEEELYTENDFGMPFLPMLKEERYPELIQIYEGLDVLQEAFASNNQELELKAAYGITNAICNTEQKDLTFQQDLNFNPWSCLNNYNSNPDDSFSQ